MGIDNIIDKIICMKKRNILVKLELENVFCYILIAD